MGFYIKQLLAGRDFAVGDYFAGQMANFVYLLGDDSKRQCMVVDPAWDIKGIIDYIDREEFQLVGALVTHYHPDHIGGSVFGHDIEGLSQLLGLRSIPVHVNKNERGGVIKVSGLSGSDVKGHEGGDVIKVGDIEVRLIHTPGHTPGSQCFLSEAKLISGDTLFIGGCGRVDLPGGDSTQMYYSLTQVLAKLPDETVVFPGHNYAKEKSSTIGEEKQSNVYMKARILG